MPLGPGSFRVVHEVGVIAIIGVLAADAFPARAKRRSSLNPTSLRRAVTFTSLGGQGISRKSQSVY